MWQDYSNFLNTCTFSTIITKHCLSEQQTISELCTHLDTLISFKKNPISLYVGQFVRHIV